MKVMWCTARVQSGVAIAASSRRRQVVAAGMETGVGVGRRRPWFKRRPPALPKG
jgi:hypothetical protein